MAEGRYPFSAEGAVSYQPVATPQESAKFIFFLRLLCLFVADKQNTYDHRSDRP